MTSSVAVTVRPFSFEPKTWLAWGWMVLGAYALTYAPAYYQLAIGPWDTPQEGHGPFILGAAVWLAWSRLRERGWQVSDPAPIAGWAAMASGLFFLVIGRSQEILLFDVASQIPILVGLCLLFGGWALVRLLWFPLFFLCFTIPLPGWFMDALTSPLKTAVSVLVTDGLYALGYPIAQNGVVIMIGQYQLLVEDACAGLNSMFSLSAVSLFYLYLVRDIATWQKAVIIAFILPISFFANFIRVALLVLITYHVSDGVAQGFIHDFSGLILFVAALGSVFLLERGLQFMAAAGRFIAGLGRRREISA